MNEESTNSGQPPAGQMPRLDTCPEIHYAGEGVHGAESRSLRYCLRDAWCLHTYDYLGRIWIGDWSERLLPGALSLLPPGTALRHEWRKAGSRHFFIHFAPGRSGAGKQSGGSVPFWWPQAPESIRGLIRTAAGSYSRNPGRASIALWEALHEMRESSAAPNAVGRKGERMREEVHRRLAEPIDLAAIARAVGLSNNQANRVFRNASGRTLCDYWRRQKLERATHLLRTTDLPVKHIAAELGYSDLHQFNKLMRRFCGQSPRSLRPRGVR